MSDALNYLLKARLEALGHYFAFLKDAGVSLVFSGLKKQVLDVMRATGLLDAIGSTNLFATEDLAIAAIYQRFGVSTLNDPFLVATAP